MKDMYKILGVAENADQDAIKKAYRNLAKQNHPDVTGGDKKKTERFKEVNEAYAVLGDEKKRQEYERLRHAPVGADGMPQGFDAETFAQTFGGGGGFRSGPVHGEDINDLFASLFGGRGGFRQARGPVRGPDMTGQLPISLREAALGTRRTIQTGSGGTVEVQVPPGVDTGGRLRVAGQGGRSARSGPAGDLHLEVVVERDPILRRNGADIEMDLPLTIAEAALGTKVDVPTLEAALRLSVPPGTSGGAKLRLRGKGIKRPDGSRGDQICVVQIVVPKVTPDDQETRRLIEELDRRTKVGPIRPF